MTRYMSDRQERPGDSQLILAYRNADTRLLNDAVRSLRREAGELAAGVAVGGADFAPGDRIVFLKNDHRGYEVANLDRGEASAGVKNGTVETAEPERFVVRLDAGRRVALNPAEYHAIAHGYAVTVHKSQGATVDRVYALADPMMNRNVAYVALTRHRQSVELYADRETFGSREDLDRVLSRASTKDLGRDYAVATVERAAARATAFRDQATSLRHKAHGLREALATLDGADSARRRVEQAREDLAAAARQVYARPAEAVRAMTEDPLAPAHLAVGHAAAYGDLRGRTRLLLGPNAERKVAASSIAGLRAAFARYDQAAWAARRQQEAVTEVGRSRLDLQRQLDRVVSEIGRVEAAMQAPRKSMEVAFRELGDRAAKMALDMLPAALRPAAQLAARAIQRTLDLGLGR